MKRDSVWVIKHLAGSVQYDGISGRFSLRYGPNAGAFHVTVWLDAEHPDNPDMAPYGFTRFEPDPDITLSDLIRMVGDVLFDLHHEYVLKPDYKRKQRMES